MEHKIIVVGIGPGAPEYLLPIANHQIGKARTLVGSKRALETFARKGTKTQAITGKLEDTFFFINENLLFGDVVVMVSGDPGYYSLLPALRKNFSPAILSVIPGISSMQLAFAKLALPWQDAQLVSLHGRIPEKGTLQYKPGKILGMLTDTVYTSKKIVQLLSDNQWPLDSSVYICARLSYADEEIVETTLEKAATEKEFSHCIMVVVS